MRESLNRFDWIANYYDSLSKVIYGKTLERSQLFFLSQVPNNSRILILGGGTGKILSTLLKMNDSCRISYVEASARMLSLARKQIPARLDKRVQFIHGMQSSVPDHDFDIIITNFYLDMFSAPRLPGICADVNSKLRRGGLWFITDFVDQKKWWQAILLWTMYRFFVLTCGIEGSNLPDWQNALRAIGLREESVKLFYGGFIKSSVFVKP